MTAEAFNELPAPFRLFPQDQTTISQLLPHVSIKSLLLHLVLVHRNTSSDPAFPLFPNESGIYALYMRTYKVVKCRLPTCDRSLCFEYHNNDDRRRPIDQWKSGMWSYRPEKCPNSAICIGENCSFAHNSWEILYHPMKFRTQRCAMQAGEWGLCLYGLHCPYSHHIGEFRRASPGLSKEIRGGTSDFKPAACYSALSLRDISLAKVTIVTRSLADELLGLQQQRIQLQVQLEGVNKRVSRLQEQLKCALCGKRPRQRLGTCGHGVCERCAVQTWTCGVCAKEAKLVGPFPLP